MSANLELSHCLWSGSDSFFKSTNVIQEGRRKRDRKIEREKSESKRPLRFSRRADFSDEEKL